MPLDTAEYRDRLDKVTAELRNISEEHSEATLENRKWKAKFELIEGQVFEDEKYLTMKISEKEKIARAVAEKTVDEDGVGIWTNYNEAKGNLEALNKKIENLNMVRFNLLGQLKVGK